MAVHLNHVKLYNRLFSARHSSIFQTLSLVNTLPSDCGGIHYLEWTDVVLG